MVLYRVSQGQRQGVAVTQHLLYQFLRFRNNQHVWDHPKCDAIRNSVQQMWETCKLKCKRGDKIPDLVNSKYISRVANQLTFNIFWDSSREAQMNGTFQVELRHFNFLLGRTLPYYADILPWNSSRLILSGSTKMLQFELYLFLFRKFGCGHESGISSLF